MTNARDFAFGILRRWTSLEDPPFVPDRVDPVWEDLAPRDRAFAFDLLTGVIRWRGALDAVIASRLRQPIDELEMPVRAILWVGAYQVLFQATADYAAVDTAVATAKRVTPRASGLVNAVLRGITRLLPRQVPTDPTAAARLSRRELQIDIQTRLCFNTELFPDPTKQPGPHLAAVRSHPLPLVQHFRKLFGDDQTGQLLLRNNQRPVITLRVDAESLNAPATAGLSQHATAVRFLVASEGWNDALESLVRKGNLSPQDPTSAKPVRRVLQLVKEGAIPEPKRILDLCAGLGTKTVQLARAFPNAAVVATDVDSVKLNRLALRAKDLKLTNVATAALDSLESESQKFDLVLVDVPCSNTGVLGKRVQSRWRWPKLDHAALAQLQQKLLTQSATLSRDAIIYATCSIDPVENENRAKTLLQASTSLSLLAEESTLPSLSPDPTATHDGGYYAIFRK